MAPEVVSVPTRGIERWLTQRLSAHLGASPGGTTASAPTSSSRSPGPWSRARWRGRSGTDPDADPWLPQRAVWPLIEVVENAFRRALAGAVGAAHQELETVEGSKRFSSIRHVADLFDRYAVHRPDMLQRWATGSPQLDEAAWQVELWRLLRERIGEPEPGRAARRRLPRGCGTEPELLDLPPRLSLFGLTRLPASYLDVLEAMAAGRDVHLFLLHPSPALWDRLAPQIGPSSRIAPRAEDPTAGAPRQSAAASWGRDAREMQLVLGGGRPHGTTVDAEPASPVDADPAAPDPGRHPGRPRARPGAGGDGRRPRPLLEPDDDSIRVHSCHGRGRQVEVLRDAVLHLLEDDPDPGAARHHRHVSRHRELRAAHSGDLRRRTTCNGAPRTTRSARSRSDWPTAPCARPTR